MLHVDKNRSHVKIILARVDIIMMLVDITCLDHEGQQNAAIETIILCVTVNFFSKRKPRRLQSKNLENDDTQQYMPTNSNSFE